MFIAADTVDSFLCRWTSISLDVSVSEWMAVRVCARARVCACMLDGWSYFYVNSAGNKTCLLQPEGFFFFFRFLGEETKDGLKAALALAKLK